MEESKFYKSLRNSFLRNTLIPIFILVIIWALGILLYNLLNVRLNTQNANKEMFQILEKQHIVYSEMLLDSSDNDDILNATIKGADLPHVNEFLYKFVAKQNIGSIFYLFNKDGYLVASNTWDEREENKINNDYSIIDHYDKFTVNEIKDESVIFEKRYYRETQGHRDCIYSMAAPLYTNGEVSGYLVFEWLLSDIKKFINTHNINYLVVTDKYNYAITSSDDSILGHISKFKPTDKSNGIVKINETKMYMISSSTDDCPFIVYTLSNLKIIIQLVLFASIFIMLTTFSLIIIMLHLSRKVAQNNTAHLEELITAVESMSNGNYRYEIKETDENDVFEYLSTQYKLLANKINQLLEINQELSNMNRKAEIKQLQAQFNPHLIFNVLENIKYMIFIQPEKAGKMITLLANLLRYSIKNGQDMVTIRQDIEYIKAYLDLQKERFDNRLSYSITIPETIMDAYIPKLILQPLVENCINHNFKNKESLQINLIGSIEEDIIKLRVIDNGDGIAPERLKYIREKLSSFDSNTDSIGLYNSHRRLQLLYGLDFGLKIDSTINIGTEILVVIPAETDYFTKEIK